MAHGGRFAVLVRLRRRVPHVHDWVGYHESLKWSCIHAQRRSPRLRAM
jgi:hypothetical protein